tara:strand:+ start:646 stop:843 length:198 start_codon:yes stop_codon:yes gene_type:complete
MRKETELTVHLLNQKLDRIEKNHLPHITGRLVKLESNQWWLMGIGLSTLGAVFAATLGIIFFPQS